MKPLKLLLVILSFAFVNTAISQTVYTTKTGEKYHTSSCRYLKYSKKAYTLEKAKALGFSACSVCKPNTQTSATNGLLENKQSTTPVRTVTAKQCTGKTKAKKRCKRKTKNANQRCYQH
ncbi:hypothetical protein N7U66_07515 [Lacinutrix neustonica]|uniref:Ada DNA repair metal-binding domain-containing protein n=1 Tax=Lacinutrix neustonica TaxID=2980107 RepID=A0A9E8MZI7_9FLAO|nr:hypothetical protein [Lacinutrix neustonica]WAC03372.1 hypothetical protein N7U66_07515 [Lacinutrix neustonica]